MYVHATTVALRRRGARDGIWAGVLLRGPSGAGKSDLALRLIEAGGRLVSDDQTHLAARGKQLIATAPPALAGLIEARGVGIVKLGRGQLAARATVALLVDLVSPEKVQRLPEPAREAILGISLSVMALAPFEASAVTKLHLALAQTAAA
jgi:serine kinase of HPr protein (carbohydrate metabolism regulator)